MKPIFEWNESLGTATCIVEKDGEVFFGEAICHDNDEDMKSEKTGCEIAFRRAKIEALKYLINYKITPELKAYKQLYYSMNKSKYFNPKSYENKMLQRKIREKELDLTTTKEMLATEKKNLKAYIDEKENFYQKIRKNRTTKAEINQKDKNN